jgi:membrane protein implicated in regulation of membrane protease activity
VRLATRAFQRDSVIWALARAVLVLIAIVGTTALLLFVGGYAVDSGLAALWRLSLGSW